MGVREFFRGKLQTRSNWTAIFGRLLPVANKKDLFEQKKKQRLFFLKTIPCGGLEEKGERRTKDKGRKKKINKQIAPETKLLAVKKNQSLKTSELLKRPLFFGPNFFFAFQIFFSKYQTLSSFSQALFELLSLF